MASNHHFFSLLRIPHRIINPSQRYLDLEPKMLRTWKEDRSHAPCPGRKLTRETAHKVCRAQNYNVWKLCYWRTSWLCGPWAAYCHIHSLWSKGALTHWVGYSISIVKKNVQLQVKKLSSTRVTFEAAKVTVKATASLIGEIHWQTGNVELCPPFIRWNEITIVGCLFQRCTYDTSTFQKFA